MFWFKVTRYSKGGFTAWTAKGAEAGGRECPGVCQGTGEDNKNDGEKNTEVATALSATRWRMDQIMDAVGMANVRGSDKHPEAGSSECGI